MFCKSDSFFIYFDENITSDTATWRLRDHPREPPLAGASTRSTAYGDQSTVVFRLGFLLEFFLQAPLRPAFLNRRSLPGGGVLLSRLSDDLPSCLRSGSRLLPERFLLFLCQLYPGTAEDADSERRDRDTDGIGQLVALVRPGGLDPRVYIALPAKDRNTSRFSFAEILLIHSKPSGE